MCAITDFQLHSTPRAANTDPNTVMDNYCKWAAAQPPLKCCKGGNCRKA